MYTIHLTVLTLSVAFVTARKPCDSTIYCYGNLLHTIQVSDIFNDSKTFVDMSLRHSPEIVEENFQVLFSKEGPTIEEDSLKNFVHSNFNPGGEKIEEWFPEDWNPSPKLLEKIEDKDLKNFASDVNAIWKQLGRKIKPGLKTRP
ncbi:unnamed protein product, partial [Allacma fusca]